MFLTLNQKQEMIQLSEECMCKAKIGWNLGLVNQLVSQVVNAEETFLKEIKSAALIHIEIALWPMWRTFH